MDLPTAFEKKGDLLILKIERTLPLEDDDEDDLPQATTVQIEGDFSEFDLVLAMDQDNVSELREICPSEYQARIRLLMEFAIDSGSQYVPDPYYGGGNGFEKVLDLVEIASRGLIDTLKSEY